MLELVIFTDKSKNFLLFDSVSFFLFRGDQDISCGLYFSVFIFIFFSVRHEEIVSFLFMHSGLLSNAKNFGFDHVSLSGVVIEIGIGFFPTFADNLPSSIKNYIPSKLEGWTTKLSPFMLEQLPITVI